METVVSLVLIILATLGISALGSEGLTCNLSPGKQGKCKPLTDCSVAAQRSQARGELLVFCNGTGEVPIICCDVNVPSSKPPTTRQATKAKIQPGVISRRKCEEYSKWMKSPVDGKWIAGQCDVRDLQAFNIEETTARKLEFPHMAILGFSDGESDPYIAWECSGSLISKNFVLTSAHCARNRAGYNVSHVRLGLGDKASIREYEVEHIHVHPKYSPKMLYYDIALLQLKTDVEFDNYRRPGCLHLRRRTLIGQIATATGWRKSQWGNREPSLDLVKAQFLFLNQSECGTPFKNNSRLERGFDDRTQVCTSSTSDMDMCEAFSSGLLQTVLKKPNCMYSIIGISTFSSCSSSEHVHTRIWAFIPWIEEIVWPQRRRTKRF